MLPILAILATVTIVGAPLGLGALFLVLPALAFIGWIVAAIWIGDWILGRSGGQRAERPYAAAVVGVLVLALAGIVPFVSAIATLFGFGALLVIGVADHPPAHGVDRRPGPEPAGPERGLGGTGREPAPAGCDARRCPGRTCDRRAAGRRVARSAG